MSLRTTSWVSAVALLIGASAARADVTNPFPGVTLVKHGDRAMAIGDLCSAGVSVRATKYAERKATPAQWATNPAVNADVAINGDFFDFPGWTMVVGRARGDGEEWPANEQNKENRTYWQFGPAMADLISPASTEPSAAATQILGGHNVIVQDGRSKAPGFDGDAVITTSHRRTGVGLNASRSKIYLFASDASLDGTAMAASMLQMAAEGGAPDLDIATNEDGGGSSQMYVRGQGQIVDSGRQVNNHLGIIASGSGANPNCWHRDPTQAVPTGVATCGHIAAGEGLAQGTAVSSCDGRFTLIEQTDGNLVLYGPKGHAKWANYATGYDGYALLMQADGNLVDYSPYSFPAWSSTSSGHPGAFTALQNDGNMVVYDGSTALWNSGTVDDGTAPTSPTEAAPPAPTACGKIEAEHGLALGGVIMSCDRRFTLTMQADGDLVLTQTADAKVLWSTHTVAAVGYALWMRGNGNLVVDTPYENTVWASGAGGHPGAYFAVQDDGNLVVYDGSTALWNSHTVDADAPYPPAGEGGGGGSPGSGSGSGSAATGTSGAGGDADEGGSGCTFSSGTSGEGGAALVAVALSGWMVRRRARLATGRAERSIRAARRG